MTFELATITRSPPLLETNDQADGLHIGFVISSVEKTKVVIKMQLWPQTLPLCPQTADGLEGSRASQIRTETHKPWDCLVGVKPRAAIHSASPL